MRETRSYGSVRGVPGDRHPYRDPARDLIKEGNWIVDKQPYAIYRRARVHRSAATSE